MVTAKRIVVDTKTGKQTYEDFEFLQKAETSDPPKGVDLEKLKDILLNNGLITDKKEVE